MGAKTWKKVAVAVLIFCMLLTGVLGTNRASVVNAAQIMSGGEDFYVDGTELSELMQVPSPEGNIVVKIWKDTAMDRYFYSVSNQGECIINASQLGIVTDKVDFSSNAEYVAGKVCEVTDTYTLLNGKHDGEIEDVCNEYSFGLIKDGDELTVTIRVYDDGMAYSYSMAHGAGINNEVSEFIFPDEGALWTYTQSNVTYEGTYRKTDLSELYDTEEAFTTPTLVQTGNSWVLLTEASVFDDEECYCSSYFETEFDSKSIKWRFGNKQAARVVMENAFETPWRVAIIGSDLNTVVNSDIVTSVCKDAVKMDYSWVQTGKLAWSWWSSTGDDPIAYEPQYNYIDFAANNGWEYVCLDYGWVLWEDYKSKVEELVNYAKEKGVGIWLWYGVNDVGHSAAGAYPKYSLLDEETICTEMEWAQSIGVRGVKVDYYESDSQLSMEQMHLCAKIAAQHQLMVLFHGCTNPGGENRTFPNVLSYEAMRRVIYIWKQRMLSWEELLCYLPMLSMRSIALDRRPSNILETE